ncbi:MAG: hypothetical protein C4289_12730 [Chloroflexota bacterium]
MDNPTEVFRDEAERLFRELDGAVARIKRDLKYFVQLMHAAQHARPPRGGAPSAASYVLGMQSRLAGIAWELEHARRVQARLLVTLQQEARREVACAPIPDERGHE